MKNIDRRSALSLGSLGIAAAAAAPLLALATPVAAQGVPEYGPDEGVELSPGVRWVDVGEVESQMTAYKTVMIGDAIYQPGAADPVDQPLMDMDMVCYILRGEFSVQKAGIPPYIVKEGGAYTCGIGKSDQGTNISDVVGIMRVLILVPAESA